MNDKTIGGEGQIDTEELERYLCRWCYNNGTPFTTITYSVDGGLSIKEDENARRLYEQAFPYHDEPLLDADGNIMGIQTVANSDAIAAWNRRADHIRDTTKMVSNADRIRSMSDEELHKFLLDFEAGDVDYAKTFCDLCCKDAALEQRSTDCEGCLLWWLKNDATLPQGLLTRPNCGAYMRGEGAE